MTTDEDCNCNKPGSVQIPGWLIALIPIISILIGIGVSAGSTISDVRDHQVKIERLEAQNEILIENMIRICVSLKVDCVRK